MAFPFHFSRGVAWLLAIVPAVASAAMPSTRPSSRPAEFPPDLDKALHQINRADPAVVPTILLWLGSEQDGLLVGRGSPRLRLACYAAKRFRITDAVPGLVSIYDNPTAVATIRDLAAEAAIRVDPFYSFEFLRDVMDDSTLSIREPNEVLSPAQRAAAGALASSGNEEARALLLTGYTAYLDSLVPGQPPGGRGTRNYGVAYELSKIADPMLIERVKALGARYPLDPARDAVNSMIVQLNANMLPDEELIRILRSDAPQDVGRHASAAVALGHKSGPEVLDLLKSVRRATELRVTAASQPSNPASTQASTTQLATTQPAATQVGSSQPTTRPSADEELLSAYANAISNIEIRNPVAIDDPPGDPAATQPVRFPGPLAVPDDGLLVRPEQATVRRVNGVPTRYFMMNDPAGVLPPIQAVVADETVFATMKFLSYGDLARVKLTDDRAELLAIREVRAAPGETTPDGFVLLGRKTVKEGKWEHAAVVLGKLGQEVTAEIPNRRRADGTYAPDAKMLAVSASLDEGATVEAGVDPGPEPKMLSYLVPYRPPIAARLVRLTNIPDGGVNRPAIELIVARKRRTFVLPEGAVEPTLDAATLQSLPAGTALKVTVVTGISPPALARVELDCAIATRDDGDQFAIRVGRVGYSATRQQDYRGLQSVAPSRDHEIMQLRIGLPRYLSDPKNTGLLAPEKLAAIRQSGQQLNVVTMQQADVSILQSSIVQWSAAGPDERPAIEKQMALLMSRVSLEIAGREEQYRQQLKALLAPGQYHDVLEKGRVRTVGTERTAAEDAATAARAAAEHAAQAMRRPTTEPVGSP